MNLYFTYESRLKSFTLFITVKTIMKLNLGHGDNFEKEILQIRRHGLVLQTTHNLVISRCSFAEDGTCTVFKTATTLIIKKEIIELLYIYRLR